MMTFVTAAVAAAGLLVPVPGPAGGVSCEYILRTWSGGFVADILMTNSGPPVSGWTVTWTFTTPTTIISTWNAGITEQGAVTTATNVSYNAVIDTGRSVMFGWTAKAASTTVPDDIAINGVAC